MNTTTRTSTAERLGRAFGRGWRAYARCERRASNWLVSKGMPTAGATALVWMVKLAALGVLLAEGEEALRSMQCRRSDRC